MLHCCGGEIARTHLTVAVNEVGFNVIFAMGEDPDTPVSGELIFRCTSRVTVLAVAVRIIPLYRLRQDALGQN